MPEEQKPAQPAPAPAAREGGDVAAPAPAPARREGGHHAGPRREGGPGGGRREGGPGGPGGGPGGPRRGKRQYFRKKKVCKFCVEKMDFIDYKRADILAQFVQERGKILPRRMTGVCSRHRRWHRHGRGHARPCIGRPFRSAGLRPVVRRSERGPRSEESLFRPKEIPKG